MAMFAADRDARLTYVNAAWERLMGVAAADAIGHALTEWFDPVDHTRFAEAFTAATRVDNPQVVRGARPGQVQWLEVSIQSLPLAPDDGERRRVATPAGDDTADRFVGAVHDATEVVEATRLAEVLQALFEATPDLVGVTDDRFGIVYVNPAARDRFGLGDIDVRHMRTDDIFPPEAFELYYTEMRPHLLRGDSWTGLVPMRDVDGNTVDVWQTVVAGVGPAKTVEWLATIGRDVTDVSRARADLEYRATHDPLTGLPNRTMLLDHLRLALARRDREQRGVGLVFIDLDGFKDVNDRYGHDAGDVVLREIASRLAHVTRPSDTVARYGGDEFVVLLDGLHEGMHEATQIGARLVDAIGSTPVSFGRQVRITASAGIAVAPAALDKPERLITAADRLMYRAKRSGGNGVAAPSDV